MSWTDERVELLKKMWSEGQSASQIAKELGGVTRNAVIGKVHRLGLSNRVGAAPEPAPKAKAADPTDPGVDGGAGGHATGGCAAGGSGAASALPFGDGLRCVAGGTRFPVMQTNAQGFGALPLDFGNLPAGLRIQSGEAWYFQFWYRDPFGPGGTGFNLSDGLQVIFCD